MKPPSFAIPPITPSRCRRARIPGSKMFFWRIGALMRVLPATRRILRPLLRSGRRSPDPPAFGCFDRHRFLLDDRVDQRRTSAAARALIAHGDATTTRQPTVLDTLPKAELHLHLEGSIRPETAVELAARHGVKLTPDEVTARYNYSNFAGFIEAFKWVTSFLRDPEDYALITRKLARRAYPAERRLRGNHDFGRRDAAAHAERGSEFHRHSRGR